MSRHFVLRFERADGVRGHAIVPATTLGAAARIGEASTGPKAVPLSVPIIWEAAGTPSSDVIRFLCAEDAPTAAVRAGEPLPTPTSEPLTGRRLLEQLQQLAPADLDRLVVTWTPNEELVAAARMDLTIAPSDAVLDPALSPRERYLIIR